MKKSFLGLLCIVALVLMFSCATSQRTGIRYMEADAATGSTLSIGGGVTIISFDGETVSGWRGTSGFFGKQSAIIYIPAGLHKFVAKLGFIEREFEISFTPGRRYIITSNINNTGFIFEEMR